ncbi:transcriptional regulator SlyA [Oxobacter pfennigii]|uniref:Transcriptional regulator SlyA n=1 Tax=Oxobacter pfennigii TaxID=36849 RepID=A0A0P8X510_9CLOT|nr:MarR family transcriptional regulator [Oxobacter pfennigii]KPU45865.1 transcriptional regulator SlyA [Oxobacter pfennigii]
MYKNDSNYLRELIRILVRNLGILDRSEASCCGTTLSQCHAIIEIGRKKEISLNELAETLNLDNSTMSRTVNNLVSQELAIRETHPEDRRYLVIRLTGKGLEVFKTIESNMEVYYKDVFASIPEDKREQVIESMILLVEAVNKNKCCK